MWEPNKEKLGGSDTLKKKNEKCTLYLHFGYYISVLVGSAVYPRRYPPETRSRLLGESLYYKEGYCPQWRSLTVS